MEAILTTFGIDWRLLLVQGVNFGILLAGLTYFLYTPIMKMLEERRALVSKGVDDAARAEEELKNIEQSRATRLAEAGREADNVLANARSAANEKEREIVGRAENAAATALSEAEAQAKEAKARAIAESKEEVAKLIVLGMQKAFKESKL
ncbi:ATP synthase F0 subunit B [Acetobacteraceae bacterium]|nr:ATP synthase F0 subunit B [Candidatus Parcubacteria bacterium]